MESIGAFPEGDWESFSRMFSYEDLEFTPHFLGQYLFSNSHNTNIEGILNYSQSSSFNCPISEANTSESPFHTLDSLNSNLQYLSQETSYSSTSTTQENYNYFSDTCHIPNIDISVPIFPLDHEKNNVNNGPYNNIPAFSDNNATMGETLSNVKEDSGDRLKRMPDVTELDETNTASPPNPKKRARVSRDAEKSKKNVESSKKSQSKMARNGKEDEPNNTGVSGHSTSSYSSEEDNASQENNGGANSETIVNLNGKARASRGSATDPQSLYARKRRERINERLRILQNLVPNGTKVDLSTMLEEAVHYVKFLQLQIKLLSSDDLWMYAPLAYNGMDIGLNEKLSQLV